VNDFNENHSLNVVNVKQYPVLRWVVKSSLSTKFMPRNLRSEEELLIEQLLRLRFAWQHSSPICSDHHVLVCLSCAIVPQRFVFSPKFSHKFQSLSRDTLSSRTSQIKEGLNRLFCLIPYDIITFEVWDYVMPYWLEAIRTEVSEDELPELKVILWYVFY
jgi:hypothetical protein